MYQLPLHQAVAASFFGLWQYIILKILKGNEKIMIKALYGNLKINRKIDALIFPIKLLYILYTIPYLIFALLLSIRSLGALGNPLKEEFGLKKKILLHFGAIVMSFIGWVFILAIFKDIIYATAKP